ncbi:alpha/beta fold hydrolase [Jongsikchunia kroppenstedtii]|uniref:alpha/beta fold hydrolase n=1 Tax=Jongsikchunia kroppenstedtii TaxID=1121721 RepID=UPI00036FFC66|nr:alpha/beta hydrolase [Jongsikchunia kroppenstedtii]
MPVLAHPKGDIEYVLHDGAPDAPTLVFLHEGLGSAGQWGRLPSLLARATGMRALVYSRHGYGGSGGTGPDGARYLHVEALEVLPEVLEGIGIDTPPALVGHSDGASIAAIYASEHASAGAVLIAPHVVAEDVTLAGIRRTAEVFEESVRPSLAMFHDDPDALLRRWSGVWLSEEFGDFDITGLLPRIEAPLWVVQGTEDNYGSRLHADLITAGSSGEVTTHMLSGFGHHPHLEDPDAVSALIAGFLPPATAAIG